MFRRSSFAAALSALAMGVMAPPAGASIYGTMSNFDVFNETPTDSYGAEIELEGVHPEDVSRYFYPAHYDSNSITPYDNGAGNFGVKITYSGYNFNGLNYLAPSVGRSTNGHTCVNTPGCEHFGFSTVGAQPTASNFYWLDANGARIGNAPQQVPVPNWSYQAPAGGGDPIVRAEVEPVEVHPQRPDSIWMKVFKTEVTRAVDLAELMSGNPIVPEDGAETETEWELLEGGILDEREDRVREGQKAIVRRYEYYEYTGPYDDEHEPISQFQLEDLAEPPADELGQFITANMVAVNLAPPVRVFGDYNDDGFVNAADYVVWRDSEGSLEDYHADGDDNGRIDDDDHSLWSGRFGNVLDDGNGGGGNGGGGNGGGGGPNGVPEPTTAGLVAVAVLGLLGRVGGRRQAR